MFTSGIKKHEEEEAVRPQIQKVIDSLNIKTGNAIVILN
jgi:hypothetical protein